MNNLPQERAFVRKELQRRRQQTASVKSSISSDEDDIKVPSQPPHRFQNGDLKVSRPSQQDHTLPSTRVSKFRVMSGHDVSNYPYPYPPTYLRTPSPTSPSIPIKCELSPIDLTQFSSDDNTPIKLKTESTCSPIDLTFSDGDDSTNPKSHKRFHSPSSDSSLSSSSPPSDAESIHEHVPVWPSDFYVINVVRGFNKCEAAQRARTGVAQAFTAVFGVPFHHTTFYTHRNHWLKAPQACRDEAIAAGHNPEGLWPVFVKHARKAGQQDRRTGKKKIKI